MSIAKNMGAISIGAAIPRRRTLASRIDREIAHLLNHLLHLGYDLIAAYSTALARLKSAELRECLHFLGESHRTYLGALSECVINLGYTPTTSGDLHGLLERGRVILGDLRGAVGILKAMAANEEDMCRAYKEALMNPGMPADVRVVISEALAHETHHLILFDRLLKRESKKLASPRGAGRR